MLTRSTGKLLKGYQSRFLLIVNTTQVNSTFCALWLFYTSLEVIRLVLFTSETRHKIFLLVLYVFRIYKIPWNIPWVACIFPIFKRVFCCIPLLTIFPTNMSSTTTKLFISRMQRPIKAKKIIEDDKQNKSKSCYKFHYIPMNS